MFINKYFFCHLLKLQIHLTFSHDCIFKKKGQVHYQPVLLGII